MLKGLKIDVNKLIIIIVILIVVVLVVWGIYKYGKSKTEPNLKDVPKSVTGNLTENEVEELGALAKNLHSDMDDFSMTNNEKLYYQASILTDRKLIGLSNIFNSMYEVSSGQTLLQWLQNETFTSLFNDIDVYADTVESRLLDLDLV
jgi:hypothetical protein